MAFCMLEIWIVKSVGSRRGLELMPWPDGLEYAAAAVNLAKGWGAVLHFGGYTYPSRYTGGYPLILEFFHHGFIRLRPPFFVSTGLAVLSVFSVFWLMRDLFGRVAGAIAALTLALSPVFITYSSLVMSDVPTLCVTILAAWELREAAPDDEPKSSILGATFAWLMFGLFGGLSTIMRPTNATILVGLAVCVVVVPLENRALSRLIKAGIAVAIGFAIPVAWQLHQNAINLGSAFASGYAWWVPEVYGAGGKTFSAAYLFGPTMPRNPHGNVIVYVSTLLGLDGMLGDPGDARYFLYPFAAAAFAIVGFIAILPRGHIQRPPTDVVRAWISCRADLALLFLFVHRHRVHFAGGVCTIHRGWLRSGGSESVHARGTSRTRIEGLDKLAVAASVIVLDVLLVVSLASEARCG